MSCQPTVTTTRVSVCVMSLFDVCRPVRYLEVAIQQQLQPTTRCESTTGYTFILFRIFYFAWDRHSYKGLTDFSVSSEILFSHTLQIKGGVTEGWLHM